MQKYFIDPEQWGDGTVAIAGDDAHHIARVMRARPGDKLIVSDGSGREALVVLSAVAPDRAEGRIERMLEADAEPAVEVWVAQSLPKGDKFELILQKGTEIGAARFLPFVSARTVVQYDAKKEAKRMERWRKIVKEAAEQAHRNRIPEIAQPMGWKELLRRLPESGLALFCYERPDGLPLRRALREARASSPDGSVPGPVLLIIGPEGGFAEEEADQAAAAGAKIVSLGKRILRTESASLVALSCLFYETGEMGG
ncbi:16S rRNA (uracil(1498)-N(3))-methyltransferase [Paenibacillus thermoaerophilus]|nr:16S rRNA (uracil(1498)-N(3))-methyltransferase [Paenibacillus thermoaerophilus]TMV19208.1 16S rRNA (uracil(1498)-N(3))-methyltransferase [Paenibacillus thermoaerophilus]